MRVMVTGATGNVGTATMRALAADSRVASLVGVARRLPGPDHPDPPSADSTWVDADVAHDDLTAHLAGSTCWCTWPGSSLRTTTLT